MTIETMAKKDLETTPASAVVDQKVVGDLDAHLGYAKRDPAGRNGGTSRNGRCAKTVVTAVGPDDIVLSLSATGLTTGKISAHLAEVYGVGVSKDAISAITDRVVEGMTEWQSRPLDPAYTVIFVDAIRERNESASTTRLDRPTVAHPCDVCEVL